MAVLVVGKVTQRTAAAVLVQAPLLRQSPYAQQPPPRFEDIARTLDIRQGCTIDTPETPSRP